MIYFVQHPDDKYIKIGYSGNVIKRMAQLNKQYRTELKLLGVQSGNGETEGELHQRFSEFNRFGEWFSPSQDILDYIKENARLDISKKDNKSKSTVGRRFILTMTDEMYGDLKQISESKRANLAQIVRGYLTERIVKETGRDIVEYRVLHGGDRTKSED